MNVFQILTPLTYWLLVGLWVYILGFLLRRLRQTHSKKSLLNVLIIILAIDALRSLSESLYFGAWSTSKSGFLPIGVYDFLTRSEIVILPKLLTLIAAVLIIGILIYRWFPAEKRDRELQERIIKERTHELRESEERFRMIFENAPVLINSFDKDGQCTLWNKQCCETFGWTIDEINAHPDALALFYPDPAVRNEVEKTVIDDPDGRFREWNPVTKDGRTLTTSWANFRLPSGLVFGLGHDITERKRADRMFKNFFEQPMSLNLIATFEGIIVHTNSAWLTILGYTPDELKGTSFFKFVHPDDIGITNADMEKIKKGQTTFHFKNRYRHKNGSYRTLAWTSVPSIEDQQGYAVAIDVTERDQAEAELQLMNDALENSLNAFDIVNSEGNFTYVNHSYVELWGYDRAEEIIGTSPVGHCQDPAQAGKIISTLQATGKFEGELTAKRKDGSTFEVLMYARAAHDSEGQLIFPTTSIDITALRQAQKDVLEERNRLQFALEVCHTGAWDLNLIDHSSHRTIGHDQVFGYPAGVPDWTYEIFLDHVLPEDREEVDRKFKKAIANQSDWNIECRIRRADGKIRWIWAVGRHGNPVDGTVQFMVGVVQDITERKQTETELQKAHDLLEARVKERTSELKVRKDEAETLNRAMINVLGDLKQTNLGLETAERSLRTTNKELEAFSYSVSHDLRAPLRHIDGFVGLLLKREKNMDATSARYLDTIAHASGRMGRLIDDLLAFSRTNRTKIRTASINLNEVIQQTVKDLSTVTEGRRITWEISDLPLAQADGNLIRQVWENLIGNAIKYTGTREQARIKIGTTRKGSNDADEIVFFIQDNGAGFDPKYTDKLFGVFQRLHREDEFEGTGIGLATVSRIIHRHGGRVWAEGAVDQGATFYFTLEKAKGAE